MAGKPNAETILKFYSHDEILDLAKVKAKQETEERLLETKKHLEAISQLVSGGSAKTKSKPGRRGRPPKSDQASGASTAKKTGRRKRARNKQPLGKYIVEVMEKTPKGVPDIIEAIKANGYKSNAQDPRRVLYLELKKQVEAGNIKKTGRGLYCKK